MDVAKIQPSTILKRGAFPEMNISYSSSAMKLDLVMACKTDNKRGYLARVHLVGMKAHQITIDGIPNTSR
jgi:hypothetical protein